MATDSTAPVGTSRDFGGSIPPYTAIEIVNGGGRIAGDVRIDGDVRPDTMVRPASEQEICGAAFIDTTLRRSGDHPADVVVWLADLRSGKPLPLARRFEISHSRCRLSPRVQAVLAGGTLNVRSADRTVHSARFLRAGDGSVIAVVTENDAGQVVPNEAVLATSGRIEVRCDAHPWTRGWILAFDHPYFDVSDRRGRFAIDSIPPGRYRLMAWHERFGTIEQEVEIQRGKAATVELRLREKDQ